MGRPVMRWMVLPTLLLAGSVQLVQARDLDAGAFRNILERHVGDAAIRATGLEVKPAGEGYELSFDFGKPEKTPDHTDAAFDPLAMIVVPASDGDGFWKVTGSGDIRLVSTTALEDEIEAVVRGCTIKGEFDPRIRFFIALSVRCVNYAQRQKLTLPDVLTVSRFNDIEITVEAKPEADERISLELRLSTGPGTISQIGPFDDKSATTQAGSSLVLKLGHAAVPTLVDRLQLLLRRNDIEDSAKLAETMLPIFPFADSWRLEWRSVKEATESSGVARVNDGSVFTAGSIPERPGHFSIGSTTRRWRNAGPVKTGDPTRDAPGWLLKTLPQDFDLACELAWPQPVDLVKAYVLYLAQGRDIPLTGESRERIFATMLGRLADGGKASFLISNETYRIDAAGDAAALHDLLRRIGRRSSQPIEPRETYRYDARVRMTGFEALRRAVEAGGDETREGIFLLAAMAGYGRKEPSGTMIWNFAARPEAGATRFTVNGLSLPR